VYSRLRFIQCAALVLFGIIIAVGVPPLLVTAVRQPLDAGSRISDGPAVPAAEVPPVAERASQQPPERRDEAAVPQELPRQAETKPPEPAPTAPPAALAIDDGPKGATAEVSSGAETAPAKPPTEIQQAATIVIRPTSVQDVYYYSRRGAAPPSGIDGPNGPTR
jgi:hypothetical protein